MFRDKLNEYMDMLQCSGKELSECSGISEATVSRYKSGERMPNPNSEDMEKLCRGICSAAKKKQLEGLSYQTVLKELNELAKDKVFDYSNMQTKFNMLCSVLSVNAAEMSKSLKYDASYISRIRSGKRKPADPKKFAFDVAEYIAQYYDGENDKKIIAQLINKTCAQIETKNDYAAELTKWLIDGETTETLENPMKKFLEKLNDFDLNEYIKAIRFDELKVPSLPFQLPTSKNYYGVEAMKNGELDFLKATALSKSKQSVFMYSDMQMDDMAEDADFSKKYMFGLAAMLKKGLHLHVVHNLNRPFHELMLGLECWIPLYMTGQISPYYLKGVHNQVYCHFLNVSGAAALAGESIAGYHAKGKYYLTKSKDELAYYRERAECILKKAQPLMDIYREDTVSGFNAFLLADAETDGKRRNILSTLPIYTMPEDFLHRFLDNRSIREADKQKIMQYAAMQRKLLGKILENNTVTDIIPNMSKSEFEIYPILLSAFWDEKDIMYSYDEYMAHLEYTKAFSASNPNYSVRLSAENAFRNIQIMIHEGEWVMISKSKSPTIQFVIKHAMLRDAIENLYFPIVE
ncbi:MAG: helix-turn-helix domain-containing protein [Clostridia bacterium]